MTVTVEKFEDQALSLPSESRVLLDYCVVGSLGSTADGYIRQAFEAGKRRQ